MANKKAKIMERTEKVSTADGGCFSGKLIFSSDEENWQELRANKCDPISVVTKGLGPKLQNHWGEG